MSSLNLFKMILLGSCLAAGIGNASFGQPRSSGFAGDADLRSNKDARLSGTIVDGPGAATYTHLGKLHVCPEGYGLTGVRIDKRLFVCRQMPETATDYFVDSATRHAGVRGCPIGTYIRGLEDTATFVSDSLLVCAFDRRRGNTEFAGSEKHDVCLRALEGCTAQNGIHVCRENSVMTSYHGPNIYGCRPVSADPSPIEDPVDIKFGPGENRSFQALRPYASLQLWQTLSRNWLSRILDRKPHYVPASVPFLPMEPKVRVVNGVRQEHVKYPSPVDGEMIEAWISFPPNYDPKKKYPAIFVTHGHTTQLIHTANRSKRGSEDHAIAYELALHGAITLAAEVRGFGSFKVPDGHYSYTYAIGPGRYPQLYLGDNLMNVTQLLSIEGADPSRTAVVGLSLGGYQSMWLGALDTRIRKVAVAGLFLAQDCLNSSDWHHGCQTVPAIKSVADNANLLDTEDLAALIAPRSLLITWGRSDIFYKWNPNKTCRINAYDRTARLYRSLDIPDRLSYVEFDGGHEIDLNDTVEWILNTPFY